MKIVIVGAGTSGWSAAALLSAAAELEITVIEPSDIPTIGVGESTIPYINRFHNSCQLPFNDEEWLDKIDGTMKFGILFDRYFEENSDWFHPFVDPNDDYFTSDTFLRDNSLRTETETQFVYNNYFLGKKVKSGYKHRSTDLIRSGLVSYHIDAKKYAELLKYFCLMKPNITLNTNQVIDAVLDDSESMEKLIMSDGEELFADLFIDCTGFNSILSNKMNNRWIDFQERLFVDSALVVQLPYLNKEKQLHNYTYCRAMNAGWHWHIPLQSRIGFGYNYSSRHVSHEEAEEEFRNHLCSHYGYTHEQIVFRRVPYCAGYRENGWKKNVISLGLSGFFLEPIEATAIGTLHNFCSILFNLLTSNHILWEKKIERFNDIFKQSITSTAEYIELHYNLTSRDDTTFWRDYKNMQLSETQKELLIGYADPNIIFDDRFVKSKLPSFNLFNYLSYFFLFFGAGIEPNCGADKIKQYLYK